MSDRITSGSLSSQAYHSRDNTIKKSNLPQPRPAESRPVAKVNSIEYRFRELESIDPAEIINDDPVFKTRDAAKILGVTYSRMEKWRQRKQGPNYLRYEGSDIRYELSALIRFKAAHRVRPSQQPRPGKR